MSASRNPGGASQMPGRLGEVVVAIAFAAAGFLVTAGLLHAAISDPLYLHADERSEKLAMLREWHSKVFSAAFGTSHVHQGFDPAAFDLTLQHTPLSTHTANLAVEGGAQPEQLAMAREFVKQLVPPARAGAPPQPCLVILELGAGANFTPDHMVTARAINVYDWNSAKLVSHLVSPQMPLEQRLGRIGYAAAELVLHEANVGMLSDEIFKPPLSQKIMKEQTGNDRRGQMLLSDTDKNQQELQNIAVASPRKPSITDEPILPGNAQMIQQLAAASAVPNLSFVYVVMPKLTDLYTGQEYPGSLHVGTVWGEVEVPIVNLARADRFHALYDPRLWHDPAHLYPSGAALASRILAQQLTRWYAQHGGPKPCG